MNPALAGVALAVVAGAVVTASARNARTAIFGLVIVMVLSPAIAAPIPEALGLAARIVGAVLAAYLLWIASRGDRVETGGSQIGWPTEVFLAVAAAAAGYGSHGLGVSVDGPVSATAAGFAVAGLAVLPVVTGRDTLRVGLGLCLLLAGSLLILTGLSGTPGSFDQVLIGGLVATLGGAVALLLAAARSDEVVRPAGPR